MDMQTSWDWHTEKKEIPLKEWQDRFVWVEEYKVSPDGEKIAAIVNKDEGVFTVCENGKTWGQAYEKAWSLKYSPTGRLTGCVMADEEWTICVDGSEWNTWFDFVWDLAFTRDGSHVGLTVQQDMKYGMAVDDVIWPKLYENISQAVLHDNGTTAAAVQVSSMGSADIEGFKKGIFACVQDGVPLDGNYLNIWDLTFNANGDQLAYAARLNRSDYTIVQDGHPWDMKFQTVWKPRFLTNNSSLLAPVRLAGKWYLYKDGEPFWKTGYNQLWNPCVTWDNQKVAAIVSDNYGRWSIAENNRTWHLHTKVMISGLCYSEDGSTLVATVKDKGNWILMQI